MTHRRHTTRRDFILTGSASLGNAFLALSASPAHVDGRGRNDGDGAHPYSSVHTGNLPIIAGPAVADTTTSTPTGQDWLSFTNEVLTLFLAFQYPVDQHMAWTIHNYGDIRYDTNLARQARATTPAKATGSRSRGTVTAPQMVSP
jgi:hypothetical protein